MVKFVRVLLILIFTVAVAEIPTQGFAQEKEDKAEEAEAAAENACEEETDKAENDDCDQVKKKKKKKKVKRDCVPSGSRISRC